MLLPACSGKTLSTKVSTPFGSSAQLKQKLEAHPFQGCGGKKKTTKKL